MTEFKRAYRRDHPLALWFSASVALVAAQAIFFPESQSQSPQTLALSENMRTIFYWTWLIGGGMAAIGLWYAHFKAEAAGMALIGFSFLAYGVIIIGLLGLTRGSWIFLFGLGFGCIHKSWHLATLGPTPDDEIRVPETDGR